MHLQSDWKDTRYIPWPPSLNQASASKWMNFSSQKWWEMGNGKGGRERLCAASISCRVNFNLLLFCDRMRANKTLGSSFFLDFFPSVLTCLCVCVFESLFVWLAGQMIYPVAPVHSARGQVWDFKASASHRAAISFNDRKRQPTNGKKLEKMLKNKTASEIKTQPLRWQANWSLSGWAEGSGAWQISKLCFISQAASSICLMGHSPRINKEISAIKRAKLKEWTRALYIYIYIIRLQLKIPNTTIKKQLTMQIFHNVNEPESRRGQHIPTYIRIYILSIYLGFLLENSIQGASIWPKYINVWEMLWPNASHTHKQREIIIDFIFIFQRTLEYNKQV